VSTSSSISSSKPRLGRQPSCSRAFVQLRLSALERVVDADVALPVEVEVPERAPGEVADRVRRPRSDHVVARLVLLQHQPHRPHVVAGVSPVAARVQVAEHELLLEAKRDPRGAMGDLSRHELERTPRRLVVVEDPRAGEEPVAAAVRADDEVGVRLRDAVRRERREGSLLGLRRLERLAEDLARRGLVEARLGRADPDRFEDRRRAHRGELGCLDGLVPGHGHERGGREVVHLVRPGFLDELEQRGLVEEIGGDEADASLDRAEVLVVRARVADDAVDVVALSEQELGQE
jgi:hypothetical protein